VSRVLSLLPILLTAACGPIGVQSWDTDTNPFFPDPLDTDPVDARIQVTPQTLTFDIAASQAPVSKPVQLINQGDTSVTVLDLVVIAERDTDVPGAFRLPDDLDLFEVVPAGETLSIDVTFDPPHGGHFEATLPFEADADGIRPVRLVADASGPNPSLSTDVVQATRAWCTGEAQVILENDGPDAMPIYDVSLGSEPGCDGFSLRPDAVDDLKAEPISVGGFRTFPVDFTPHWAGEHTCTIAFETELAQPVRTVLKGVGTENERAVEYWQTSDGSGAHVLLVHDDAASDVADHRARLSSGLQSLLESLDTEGVDYRVAAASTDAVCPVSAPRFASRVLGSAVGADLLRTTLFDSGTEWARRPLALMADAANRGGTTCFGGWLDGPDPLHVIAISARDDASGRTVNTWISQTRIEAPGAVVSTITPRSGCGPTTPRLDQAADLTSGRTLDLCASNWDGHWATLARLTEELRRPTTQHTLLATPVRDSLRVSINRVATPSWELVGEADRTLRLTGSPPDGSEVKVEYVDVSTCP